MTYTIDQVRDYVEGWLNADADMKNLTMNQIKAMLHNALNCVDDENDGIEGYVKRKNINVLTDMKSIKIVHNLSKGKNFSYEDIVSLENTAKNLLMMGWEDSDVMEYLKYTEEYNPCIYEDVALAAMKRISDKYKNTLKV